MNPGGRACTTGTHMDSVSHWKWLQWQLGTFCSPVNGNSRMRERGLRGTRLVWGIKINFYPRELLLHISQRRADRCGRQKSVDIRLQRFRTRNLLLRPHELRLGDPFKQTHTVSREPAWSILRSSQAAGVVKGRGSSCLLQLHLLKCVSRWHLEPMFI